MITKQLKAETNDPLKHKIESKLNVIQQSRSDLERKKFTWVLADLIGYFVDLCGVSALKDHSDSLIECFLVQIYRFSPLNFNT